MIEQAEGVLAERRHVSPTAAFEQMRSCSRTPGAKLHEVAERIVQGDLDLGEVDRAD